MRTKKNKIKKKKKNKKTTRKKTKKKNKKQKTDRNTTNSPCKSQNNPLCRPALLYNHIAPNYPACPSRQMVCNSACFCSDAGHISLPTLFRLPQSEYSITVHA